ncbi:MAG: hypothetical protein ACRDZ7_01445 [Acidimicrobiia bacterium]
MDGIQGATWARVHLLGTAALERFTGYTGQSRSQHPTHTWNVSRLPDIDHGGVLADQRTPQREVLDALLRVPETSFATHDHPDHIGRLLAERAEHEAVLAAAPPARRRQLRQAEQELVSARKDQQRARHRLDAAHQRIERVRPFAMLRRHGRQEKRAAHGDIERFEADVARAAARVTAAGEHRDELTDQVARAEAWHGDHDWRRGRLSAIDRELASSGHIDLRRIPLPEHSPRSPLGRSRTSALESHLDRILTGDAPDLGVPPADRWAEIARPPLPDQGLGLDL